MRLLSRLIAAVLAVGLVTQPVMAQSILRDAETEALLHDMAVPLVAAAGLDPKNVDIVMVGDNSINAFVAGGQAVYIHSGLINAASSANEVQGVIAHELGHITGGHIVTIDEGPRSFQPMNINFGLFPHPDQAITHGPDGKRLKGPAKSLARKQALTARAKQVMDAWADGIEAKAAE